MRGILMGAMGGFGKGLAENGKAAMEEQSKLRMKREMLQMEEQVRTDREAAIAARREKVLGSTADAGEIQRQGLMLGDDGLAKYGRQQIEDTRSDERYATDQDWKGKDFELREQQAKDLRNYRSALSARGGGSVGGLSTTGFSTAAREDLVRARLAEKVGTGKATPEERLQFQVMQDVATSRGKEGWRPTEAKKADYWSSLPPEEVEAEVERQITELEFKDSSELRGLLRTYKGEEGLRQAIRKKMGVAYEAPPRRPFNDDMNQFLR